MSDPPPLDDLLRGGQLFEAIAQATARVKAAPTDAATRAKLLELFCLSGEFDRAQKQLNVTASGREKEPRLQLVHNCLKAEAARRQVFTAGRVPEVIADPSEEFKTRLKAALTLQSGEETGEMLAAVNAAPGGPGTHGGEPFACLVDGDELLGPYLEFLGSDGRYYWLDQSAIALVEPGPIATVLDTIWRPCIIHQTNGSPMAGCLPAIYFGTAEADLPDDVRQAALLGYSTEWVRVGGVGRGLGQRTYFAASGEGATDIACLALQKVTFGSADTVADPASDPAADADEADEPEASDA